MGVVDGSGFEDIGYEIIVGVICIFNCLIYFIQIDHVLEYI